MNKIPRDLAYRIESSIKQDVEIECRIRFENIDKDLFQKIIDYFDGFKEWEKSHIETIDYYRKEKRFTKIGEDYINTTKKPPLLLEIVRGNGYSLKFSVAVEINKPARQPKTYDFYREKYRTRFSKKNIFVDLTKVVQEKTVSYETEVEVKDPARFNYGEFIDSIKKIVSINRDPKKEILNFLNFSIGGKGVKDSIDMALLPKPRDLKFPDLTNDGLLDFYVAMVKADGVMRFLIFHDYGIWFFQISKDKNKRLTYLSSLTPEFKSLNKSVFQGELIGDIFLPFDVCMIGGKKIISENYFDRSSHIKEILNKQIDKIKIVEKKAFDLTNDRKVFFEKIKLAFLEKNKVDYPTDGLIFTPVYSDFLPPGSGKRKDVRILKNYKDICKYKEKTDQTIDFKIVGSDLFASNRKFVGSERFPFTKENYTLESPTIKIEQGDIVEFKPDFAENKIVYHPHRLRKDKLGPNSYDVALDNWEIVHDPIYPSTLEGEDIRLLRKNNNRIKRSMISSMSGIVIDFGSGKGGDFTSYIKNQKISHVFAIEPNLEFVMEMKSRKTFNEIKIAKNFFLYEGKAEDVLNIGENLQKFAPSFIGDRNLNLNFMISLSFFFKDEETLEKLVDTIKKCIEIYSEKRGSGKIYLNFFTIIGEKVKNLFKEKGNDITLNTIKIKRLSKNSLEIDIKDSETVHSQTEYLVDLKSLFEKTGFKIENYKVPAGEKKSDFILSEPQTIYSKLFAYGYAEYVKPFEKNRLPVDTIKVNNISGGYKAEGDDMAEKIDENLYRIATIDDGKSLSHSVLKLLNQKYRDGSLRERKDMAEKIKDLTIENIPTKLDHGVVLFDKDMNKTLYGKDKSRWILLYENKDQTYEPVVYKEKNKTHMVFSKDSFLVDDN